MKLQSHALSELLAVSDSGTWGDEGQPAVSDAVLRSTNIQDSRLVLDDVAWRVVPAKDRERRALKTGDILVTKSSGSPDHIGKCCLFVEPQGGRRYYFSNFTLRLRPDISRADPRWIFYWLSSSIGRDVLARLNNTTTGLRNLDVTRYLEQRIPTPSLPEQRRIADILDKADAIRRKRKEAIALTEELLRSAFLEMFGDPVTNPKGWPTKPLGELAEIASGVTKGKRYGDQRLVTLPYMRVANVQDGHLVLDEVKTITVSKEDGERYLLKYGDVLLTEGGDPDKLGRGTVWRDEVPGCIHQNHIFRVRPASNTRAEFLSAIIGSERGKRYFLRAAKQTTGIATINMTQLKAFPVLLPPAKLQHEYVKLLERIDGARTHQRDAAAGLDNLFFSLVHRAFRGELRPEGGGPEVRSTPERDRAIESFNRLDFEPTARQLYDRLLLLRPDVLVEGLYREDSQYFFVCPDVMSIGPDGRTFKDWFEDSFIPLAMPFHLVAQRPTGSIELQPRSPREVADGHGVVRTWPDLQRDLALWLPRDVPYIDVREDDRTAVVRVGRALSPDEASAIERTFDQLGSALPFRVEVVPSESTAKDWKVDRIELKPARLLGGTLPKAVRNAVADDDDFWRQNASVGLLNPGERLGPSRTDALERSCLVSTTFPPANIRAYLSLYTTVVLVAPLARQVDSTLQALGVKRKEFVELARRRCVRLLLPQAIDRYDVAWIAEVLEGAPDSIMFSRRLAATTLADQYRRNPLFALPATAYEKRSLVRALHRAADEAPPMPAVFLRSLAGALSEYWASAEYELHVRGAMASLTGGLARFGRAVAKEVFKKDLFIEISTAAQNVEWAGALGAHLVPEQGAGYSSEGAASLLVALSSGGMKSAQATAAPKEFELAEDLLAFDNDTNVLEFVSELGKGDLARFRTLVQEIASAERSPEEIAALLETWNAQVRQYERRPDRLKSFNIAGLLLAAGSRLSANEAIHNIVPLIALLLPFMLTKANEDTIREVPAIGAVFDWANASLAGTAPPAVLLSRMRKRVVGMRDLRRGAR